MIMASEYSRILRKLMHLMGNWFALSRKTKKTETAIMVEDPDGFYSTTLMSDGHAMVRESVSEITLRTLRQMLLAYKQDKVGDTGKAIKVQTLEDEDSDENISVTCSHNSIFVL